MFVYNLDRLEDLTQSAGLDGVQPETLAKRLSQGPLDLAYALQCATDVANSLRALHEDGRPHGSVNANSVIITIDRALLLPPNGQARYTVAEADISAFGALLYEMVTGSKPSPRATPPMPSATSRNTEEGIKIAATRLASKCLRSTSNSASEIQKVLTEVRLLSLQARICDKEGSPAPAVTIAGPAAPLAAPEEPLQIASSPEGEISPPVFTPISMDGFRGHSENGAIDPPPSGVKCPVCGAFYVYKSRARTWFETTLEAWGSPPLRCHRCLHRYVVILGRFNFSKTSPLKGRIGSPASPS